MKVADGRVAKINFYQDSDPYEIADIIINKYNLSENIRETIAVNIEKKIENFLETN